MFRSETNKYAEAGRTKRTIGSKVVGQVDQLTDDELSLVTGGRSATYDTQFNHRYQRSSFVDEIFPDLDLSN